MRKAVTALVVGTMQGFRIPISVFPLWYSNIGAERSAYRPFFQPWRTDEHFRQIWEGERKRGVTFVETAYLLYSFARLASRWPGEIWECGVYQGATARLLIEARDASAQPSCVRLFDTFSGMPESSPDFDGFAVGTFGDTSLNQIRNKFAAHQNVHLHPGVLPGTFTGLEDSTISFAHIDVDQFETTKNCCEFIFPRLRIGGILIIDDYGRPKTVGARLAAEQFFSRMRITPVVLHTGQAVVVK